MSLHNNEEFNTVEIKAALKKHGFATDMPSQLADAFRVGWIAAKKDNQK